MLTRSLLKSLTKATAGTPKAYILSGNAGHVLQFRPLAQALLPRWHLNGILYPIYAGSNARYASIQDLADVMRHAVQELPDPIVLMGYSMGGAVAYEMACELRKEGRDVSVIMIDTTVPAIRRKHSSLVRKLRNWIRLRPLIWAIRRLKRKLKGKAKKAKPHHGPNHENILRFAEDNRVAVRRYLPSKGDVPIVLIRTVPERWTGWLLRDYWPSKDYGWSKVGRVVSIVDCIAGHASIVRPAYLKTLTNAVDEAMHDAYRHHGADADRRKR